MALIGAKPQHATVIAFSQPYFEIQATFLVPAESPLKQIWEVDGEGVRIAVSRRAAYCLWVENNLERATLLQTDEPGVDLSCELFLSEKCDALAGLRP